VGDKSHGLSLWQGKFAIMLSSGQGCLIQVDLAAAEAQGEGYTPTVLWEDPTRTFMKGLAGALFCHAVPHWPCLLTSLLPSHSH
jgi:hypothetical protein